MGRKRLVEAIDPVTKKGLPAGVTYRGEGQYQARKLVKGRRETRTFLTAKEAADWRGEVEADVRRGRHVSTAASRQWTVKRVLETYRDEVLAKRESRHESNMFGAVAVICRDARLASITMEALTNHDINLFADRLKKSTYGNNTILGRLELVQKAIRYCANRYFTLAIDPCQAIERPPRPKGRERRFEGDEEERAMAGCRRSRWPYLELCAKFALASCMRIGEIVSVDIDKDLRYTRLGPVVTVRGLSGMGSKNGKVRYVPILPHHQALLAEILAMPRAPGDRRLFPVPISANARLLRPDKLRVKLSNLVSVKWIKALRRAGIEDFHFHDLRHVGTGRMAPYFPNPLDLAKITGHGDTRQLMIYYNVDDGESLHRVAVTGLLPGETPQEALDRMKAQIAALTDLQPADPDQPALDRLEAQVNACLDARKHRRSITGAATQGTSPTSSTDAS